MRPIRRGASPQQEDFSQYEDAKPELVSRLGPYCSYCERKIPTLLAVEHIQPKGLRRYKHLAGRWENFLLACTNCNATKRDKDVDPGLFYLPDRDNTFVNFVYASDGSLRPVAGTTEEIAARTLALTGLDQPVASILDFNGQLVALDRVSQRMQAWEQAAESKIGLAGQPTNDILRREIAKFAKAEGFFSIWMTVFADDTDMRHRLIDAFPGTRDSGCFDPITAAPVSPAPNHDALPNGGKI